MKKIILILLMNFPFFLFGGNLDFLVDSDYVSEHMDDNNTVILETRYYPHRYYTVGHIEGAIGVERFKDLGANDETPIIRFPKKEAFQETLRNWGINDDTIIILYDDSRSAMNSRIYFLLDMYGYDMNRVKILNGGNVQWQVFNETTKDITVVKQKGTVTLKDAKPLLAEWTDIYQNIVSQRNDKYVLIDNRPFEHYTGKIVKHAVRGGHIPGAINIVSLDGTEGGASQKWKSFEDIASLYKNVPKEKTIYLYCHDGFRMTLGYMQMKLLGYKHIKLYNGGWADWGNNLSLPVVEGDKPYSGGFEL